MIGVRYQFVLLRVCLLFEVHDMSEWGRGIEVLLCPWLSFPLYYESRRKEQHEPPTGN